MTAMSKKKNHRRVIYADAALLIAVWLIVVARLLAG